MCICCEAAITSRSAGMRGAFGIRGEYVPLKRHSIPSCSANHIFGYLGYLRRRANNTFFVPCPGNHQNASAVITSLRSSPPTATQPARAMKPLYAGVIMLSASLATTPLPVRPRKGPRGPRLAKTRWRAPNLSVASKTTDLIVFLTRKWK